MPCDGFKYSQRTVLLLMMLVLIMLIMLNECLYAVLCFVPNGGQNEGMIE